MKYLLLIVFVSFTACKKPDFSVRYEVNCDDCAIQFLDRDGATIKVDKNAGKWSYEYAGIRGRFVSVSAANRGSTGNVKAVIYVGDEELRSELTTEPFGVVTASGYLDD
jgi:hypothetical protein